MHCMIVQQYEPLKYAYYDDHLHLVNQVRCAILAVNSARSSCFMPLFAWLRHALVAVSAIASFGLEDAMSGTVFGPLSHALWHCLAAAGMFTAGPVFCQAFLPE